MSAGVDRFQSTRPRGARPHRNLDLQWTRGFQSTRPRGARHGQSVHASAVSLFQSTRPRGARRGFHTRLCPPYVFQSTRPRGARPACGYCPQLVIGVSIHAPARGATTPLCSGSSMQRKFQSTRPRGARQDATSRAVESGMGFNPRAREGRDRVRSARSCR